MTELTILGTSSMVPTKERNVQSMFLTYRDEGILFDCGAGPQRHMNIRGITRNQLHPGSTDAKNAQPTKIQIHVSFVGPCSMAKHLVGQRIPNHTKNSSKTKPTSVVGASGKLRLYSK